MTFPKSITIAERYAKLRARCPVPPEPTKRRGRPRKPPPEPWELSPPAPPDTPLMADLRRRLQSRYARTAATLVTQKYQRVRTPLVMDLEARLAARAALPRQKPTARVDFGNVNQVGDAADDAPEPEMPPGERM